jgi:hypothetical protein
MEQAPKFCFGRLFFYSPTIAQMFGLCLFDLLDRHDGLGEIASVKLSVPMVLREANA